MRLYLVTIFAFALSFSVSAYNIPDKGKGSNDDNSSMAYNKANCPPSNERLFMQFNDVEALIEVGGSLWQNRQTGSASYEVPKDGGNHVIFSGSIWMGGLDVNGQLKLAAIKFRQGNDFWAGPLSQTVGSGTYDPNQPVGFDATRDFGAATINPTECEKYDKFFTIAKSEVIAYTINFECNQDPECTSDPVPISNDAINRINNWPAHGDQSIGQDFYLAPFYDYPSEGGSGDGIYDPSQGDTPWFDDILGRDDVECGIDRRVTLFGDETNWWVFNDKGNIHTETGADPIGMEIRAQAFAFATNDEVNRMTFYNYEMINRSTQTLFDTYFTQYCDADVGFSDDDYVGCDVSRGLGYTYNGDNNDEGGNGAPGYGENPPAVGIDFFEGPYQDADNIDNVGPRMEELPDGTQEYVVPSVNDAIAGDGIVYEGIGIGYSDGIVDNERFGMRRFNYFNRPDISPIAATHDPESPTDYYNYMTGFWRDNSPIYYGGIGYGSTGTTTPASYTYPGDSDPLHWGTAGQDMGWDWTETNTDGAGSSNDIGDRRMLQSAGPFTLTPGAINNLTVGVVYGRAYDGNAFSSVEIVKQNDTKAQALFDNCFEILDPPSAPVLEIVELENELVLLLDNPFGNNVNEEYAEEDNINIVDPIDGSEIDKVYTFEGYQIYQMSDAEAGVGDIGDVDRARLVAQCDIRNDIDRIINFEFDEELGFSVPIERVDGENRGIRHSFSLTEDAFASGPPELVNHKTYYYIAIAYAHNEFKEYNPTDPELLDGQQIPYISSRLAADGTSIEAVAGIPHNPAPRFDGTIAGLPYGSSPQITTLDGAGNGNRSVDLTRASEDFIVENGSIDTPTYLEGAGPIDVKVIDPLNLVDGYFTLEFEDYGSNIDTASWKIIRYDSKGGNFLGERASQRTIDVLNEQLIPEWGISVRLHQDLYPCANSEVSTCVEREKISEPIEATIDFADSSKRWLAGVQDNDDFTPFNWIASGDYDPEEEECLPAEGINNPCCYEDYVNRDNDKLYANLLDGTVTAGLLARYDGCGYNPIGVPGSPIITEAQYSSLFNQDLPTVYHPSVDIVLTSDKSKWTRCPVIEMSYDDNLSVNDGKYGMLRQSPSIDKNGNQPGDAGYNAAQADPNGTTPVGMGWFPGYAIDVETGRRLNMAYGENSFLAGENGADMIWNPTDRFSNSIGSPLLGGQHTVYVFGGDKHNIPSYDEGQYLYESLDEETSTGYRNVYGNLSWVMQPMLASGQELLATDVRVRLRKNREYSEYEMTGVNDGRPTYEWELDVNSTIKNSDSTLANALDIINVVPNPYYAFSEYERSKLDTRVKITNLPERCKVRIYNTSGKLIRAFDKDSPITSLDWNLKNGDNIPVSGGVYLIHVEVEGVGERVVKFFGGLRQPDLENL